jgi:hypothetical protein
VLAVAQALAAEGQHPDAVLISPFCDATVSDPRTPKYGWADSLPGQRRSPNGHQRMGGQRRPKRPEISPLFGTSTDCASS